MADATLYLFDGYNLLHAGPYDDRRELSTRSRASSRCTAHAGRRLRRRRRGRAPRPARGSLRAARRHAARAARRRAARPRAGAARDERRDGRGCSGRVGGEADVADLLPRPRAGDHRDERPAASRGSWTRRRGAGWSGCDEASERVHRKWGLVLLAGPCYIHLDLRVRLRWLCRTKSHQNTSNHGGSHRVRPYRDRPKVSPEGSTRA